ncbi:MAG: folate family ECF transporter S component [Eubacteriales bacterium]|nr:folate family ECF transporter S component [Eubacteriales bacterium]
MFKKSAMQLKKPITLSTAAMMIALYVVLYMVKIPIAVESRVSLTFLPIVIAGYLTGPVTSMLVGAIGDVLGFFLFPSPGGFFPGFTISSAITGLIYGIFLYGAPQKSCRLRVIISTMVVVVAVYTLLNTFWLAILYQKAYFVYLTSRIVKNVIVFPLQMILSMITIDSLIRTGITKKYI